MEEYYILTFENTHQAISCEKALHNQGFPVRIIPVPTELTADCGLCLRFEEMIFTAVSKVLNTIAYVSLYKVKKNGFNKAFTKFLR